MRIIKKNKSYCDECGKAIALGIVFDETNALSSLSDRETVICAKCVAKAGKLLLGEVVG